MRVMSDSTNGAIDESMKHFDAGFFDIGGQRLYVPRTGWTGELDYEIYSDGASTDYKRLWNDLFEAGTPHGMVFGSLKAMEIGRIEADREPLLYDIKCLSDTPWHQAEIMDGQTCVGRALQNRQVVPGFPVVDRNRISRTFNRFRVIRYERSAVFI